MTDRIEQIYQEHLDSMTVAERFLRAVEIYNQVRDMVCHRVELENPGASEREVALKVAEIMYLGDPEAQKLLAKVRANEEPG